MRTVRIRKKGGSYILEASFIYPLIVLTAAMLILVMLFLFGIIQDMSAADANVRRAACAESGNVVYETASGSRYEILERRNETVEKSEISESRDGLLKSFSQKISRESFFPSAFSLRAARESKSVWTSLDEAHIIRTADLVFERIKTG